MCELNQKREIYFELIAKQSDNPVRIRIDYKLLLLVLKLMLTLESFYDTGITNNKN